MSLWYRIAGCRLLHLIVVASFTACTAPGNILQLYFGMIYVTGEKTEEAPSTETAEGETPATEEKPAEGKCCQVTLAKYSILF